MNPLLLEIITLIFTSSNLIISIYDLKFSIENKSIITVYWLTSLYFVTIPMFFDSFFVILNLSDIWTFYLESIDTNYKYDLSNLTLARVSTFVFLFNLIFIISSKLLRMFLYKKKETYNQWQYNFVNSIPLNYAILFMCKV